MSNFAQSKLFNDTRNMVHV